MKAQSERREGKEPEAERRRTQAMASTQEEREAWYEETMAFLAERKVAKAAEAEAKDEEAA